MTKNSILFESPIVFVVTREYQNNNNNNNIMPDGIVYYYTFIIVGTECRVVGRIIIRLFIIGFVCLFIKFR